MSDVTMYQELLVEIKKKLASAQTKAVFSVNAEMLHMYFEIGSLIWQKQQHEGWGSSVIPRLAKDLHNELPEIKGFSERNIGRMIAFYHAYSPDSLILPQAVAKLSQAEYFFGVPWGHHILLLEKVKSVACRYWYMEQIVANGWSREALAGMIKKEIHQRQGKTANNFEFTLPAEQSDLARQTLKDPYIFDFLTLNEPYVERELETELVKHLE